MNAPSNERSAAPASSSRTAPPPSATKNVIANWLWYLLVLASGFVIPRLISDRLGIEQLGAWDLGWTFVFFVRWFQLGITSSVNRFIARSQAQQNDDELNAVFNTSLVMMLAACIIGFFAAAGFYFVVPRFLEDSSADVIAQARIVVVLLSLTAALQLPGGIFNAVITGYERFDLLNVIRIGRDGAILIAIAVLLYRGGSLIDAGWAYLIGEAIGDFAKIVIAKRLCPALAFAPRYMQWGTTKMLLAYGGKTVAQGLARGSLYDVNRLLVTWFLGGAEALAVYSRQTALLKHALRFMKQYAQVFIPRSSALDAGNDRAALAKLLIITSKYGLYATLPMIAVFCILGDHLVTLWMGPGYAQPVVLAIIALGHVLIIPQQGVYSVLLGMNRHGRIAIFDWISVALSFGLGWLLMGPLGMGMVGAAIALALPMAIASGILMPLYACKLLDISLGKYFYEIAPGPVLAALPMTVVFAIARYATPTYALPIGLAAGAIVTIPIYWKLVMPRALRKRIVQKVLRQTPAKTPSKSDAGTKTESTTTDSPIMARNP
jgi:O-antigen/teichoic acid export membrane protein